MATLSKPKKEMRQAGGLAFRAEPEGALKKRGLTGGHVTVTAAPDGLSIVGETGGRWSAPIMSIARLRAGFTRFATEHTNGRLFRLMIETDDGASFSLRPQQSDPAYRRTVLALARAMANAGRLERVETGISHAVAVGAMFPAFLAAALGVAIAAFAFENPAPWRFIAIPAPFAAAMGWLCWREAKRLRPRCVAAVQDLARHLP